MNKIEEWIFNFSIVKDTAKIVPNLDFPHVGMVFEGFVNF